MQKRQDDLPRGDLKVKQPYQLLAAGAAEQPEGEPTPQVTALLLLDKGPLLQERRHSQESIQRSSEPRPQKLHELHAQLLP